MDILKNLCIGMPVSSSTTKPRSPPDRSATHGASAGWCRFARESHKDSISTKLRHGVRGVVYSTNGTDGLPAPKVRSKTVSTSTAPSTKKLRPRPVPPAMLSSRAETSQLSASGAARWALRKRHTRRSSVAPRSTCRSRGCRGCSTRRNRFASSARSALTVECSARSIASPGSSSDSHLANARRTQ